MDPALVGTTPPTLANTVASRFIGRLVPGSDRFNGAFQAGQGISDTMQSGNAFRVSPRLGVVYDLSGEGRTIVRGGFGIFYDRPQGNMVFDQIQNAPGMLQPHAAVGTPPGASPPPSGDPDPTLTMAPTAYDFEPPRVMAWNVGVQHKLWHAIVLDLAYVGSSSKDLLQQRQINAVPWGAKFLPENQDPTRAPSTVPGATALADDFLRPYQGYGTIRLWEYGAFSNYHALQASLNRRFDNGLMFSVFYVWSKALGTTDDDFGLGAPERHRGGEPPRQLLLRRLRPAAQLRGQLHLPDAQGREGRARPPRERLAALGRLPLDERHAVRHRLLHPRHRERQPHRVRPARPHRGHLRPGQGLERRPLPADRPVVLRPAAARQRRHGIGAVLPPRPAGRTTSTSRSRRASRSGRASGSRCASTPSTPSTTPSSRA